MIDQRLAELEGCALSHKWLLEPDFAIRLAGAFQEIRFFLANTDVWIISGRRSREDQAAIDGSAPFELSTHADTDRNGCPRLSTGVDFWVSVFATNNVKATVGSILHRQGLRWGGGSPPDPATGIPSDWNHVDTGRRAI